MTQDRLDFSAPLIPRDSHVTDVREIKRLSGQSLKIVQRLQKGDATNRELADLCMKFTARISDARKAGYDIRVIEEDHRTGRVVYRLVPGYRTKA